MPEKGTVVRYGQTGICRIEEVCTMKITAQEEEYYVLTPLFRNGAKLYVPVNSESLVGKMLPPLTKEEILAALDDVGQREAEWIRDFRRRSEGAKKALSSDDRRDALYLIKNIYTRKKEMLGEGKRVHTTDDYFLKDAENLIYNEIAFVLEMEYEAAKKMVLDGIFSV